MKTRVQVMVMKTTAVSENDYKKRSEVAETTYLLKTPGEAWSQQDAPGSRVV